jgi:hypothetical protein
MPSNACSGRVNESSDLVGIYSVDFPFGHGSLRLGGDGQYEQVLQIGGRTASAKGKWSYEHQGGWDMFFLEHCLLATNGFGQLREDWGVPFNGACSPSIGRRFVVVGAIEIADDEEYSYRKISPSATAGAGVSH